MPSYRLSDPAVAAFIAIPVVLVGLLVWGVHSAWRKAGLGATAHRAATLTGLAALAWMGMTAALAVSGVLRQWDSTPPPFALFVLAILALAATLAFGGVGGRLGSHTPLCALVGVQAFRWPLEVAMHGMYERGIMPVQMTYTGRNFDIVTGVTAAAVAALVAFRLGGRRLVAAWNIMGLLLLTNVVTVAILATPRIRYFGDESLNVWVTYFPFVWLPAVMVLAALAGHLVIFRRLVSPARD